jgi:hypothetical protein
MRNLLPLPATESALAAGHLRSRWGHPGRQRN